MTPLTRSKSLVGRLPKLCTHYSLVELSKRVWVGRHKHLTRVWGLGLFVKQWTRRFRKNKTAHFTFKDKITNLKQRPQIVQEDKQASQRAAKKWWQYGATSLARARSQRECVKRLRKSVKRCDRCTMVRAAVSRSWCPHTEVVVLWRVTHGAPSESCTLATV